MVKEVLGRGETILLAQEDACRQLGMKSQELDFEVIQVPVKRTLGIFGGRLAEVKARVKENPQEVAKEYLLEVLSKMGISACEIEIEKGTESSILHLSGDPISLAVGKNGETLDALQTLTNVVANRICSSDYHRIILEVGDFRKKRAKSLEELVKKICLKVKEKKYRHHLDPMSAYERRMVHMLVQTIDGVESFSEGNDRRRHVVISPMHKKKEE